MNKVMLNMPLELQAKRAKEAGLTLQEWQKAMEIKLAKMHRSAVKSMRPTGKFVSVSRTDAERFQRKMDSAIA
ncbi:hypothetical protein MSG66_17945 [Acinetobacter sp. IK31]|uniref:hypothetical protein n=1 Tax=Acinetobacter sp. IK31 TaxID=2928895 RepID=UPI002D1FCBE2|nr:hypothetical protein [Acinetobacter sp. IK31]MEB3865886.1 hypothetical protein [Acinetobacter sp. IK31]